MYPPFSPINWSDKPHLGSTRWKDEWAYEQEQTFFRPDRIPNYGENIVILSDVLAPDARYVAGPVLRKVRDGKAASLTSSPILVLPPPRPMNPETVRLQSHGMVSQMTAANQKTAKRSLEEEAVITAPEPTCVPMHDLENATPGLYVVPGRLQDFTHTTLQNISADVRMGKGFALEFVRKVGGRVRSDLFDLRPKVGECLRWRAAPDAPWHLFCVTKRVATQPGDSKALRAALHSATEQCVALGVSRVSMPFIGVGLDRMSEPEVLNLLTQTLCRVVTVVLYDAKCE